MKTLSRYKIEPVTILLMCVLAVIVLAKPVHATARGDSLRDAATILPSCEIFASIAGFDEIASSTKEATQATIDQGYIDEMYANEITNATLEQFVIYKAKGFDIEEVGRAAMVEQRMCENALTLVQDELLK